MKPIASLVVLFACLSLVGAAAPPDKAASAKAYDKFKQLEGVWEGRSTKGWVSRTTYTKIAGDSCVMENEIGAHPTQAMVTMYHMDGEKFMLTHYCAAKNQPRMLASEISDDGKTMLFTFIDGTNMASRDTPHMDKAWFRFDGPDQFTTKWTFYSKGEERWMEEVVYKRIEGPATKPATQPAR